MNIMAESFSVTGIGDCEFIIPVHSGNRFASDRMDVSSSINENRSFLQTEKA
jgi:hypothetical protein